MTFTVIHPESGSVAKTEIKEKISQLFKSDVKNIAVFGLQSKFGGGRSSGFALVYDSEDARKKCD